MSRSITVVLNPSARRPATAPLAATVRELFASLGVEVAIAEPADCTGLCEAAQSAVAAGSRTVVAAGGDGTVGCVAGVVLESGASLGILPLGTLNHFAKDLGIPLDLEAAVKTIVAGHERAVDVGDVNGRVFVNNSSIGLYPTMVHQRERQQRLGKRKWSAFVRACWIVLGRYPLLRVTVETEGARLTRKTPLVFIGNNDYHLNGLKLGTRDRLDGGRLAVYVTPDVGRLGLLRFAFRAMLGRLRPERDVMTLQTTNLSINGRHHRLRVAADGEVCSLQTPLEYRIRPQALRVIVPATETESMKQ